MATYLIGDVHGCYDELIALLHKVEFTPGKHTLWLTGDLVARGPGSLDVLRYVKSLGDSVRLVLGNHDLHLLAVFAGISRNKPKDRLTPLLELPGCHELLNWLRRQPLLQIDEEKKLVMAHAGITPQWDLQTAKECARDVEAVLSSDSYPFLMPCTAICQITGHRNCGGWGRLRFYHQRLYPYAFLLPERSTGYVQQRIAARGPCPTETVVCDPGPVVKNKYNIAFVTGHRWKAKARRKVFTRWIPAAAGVVH
ncbi:bis(5'-nucleosyl)-tetraphosphatase (symmetrical) ApaH [Escherichia coli]